MRKMATTLVAVLALVGSLFAPARAQNAIPPAGTAYATPYSYYSYALGLPAYQLNGPGSSFGQVFNVAGSSAWALGSGTALTANGTPAVQWNNLAHVALGGGTKPATSSCNSNTLNAGSTDAAGSTTFTGGAQAACTLTFTNAYAAAPFCVASDAGGTVAVQANSSTTQLVLTIAAAANVTINYICIGQ